MKRIKLTDLDHAVDVWARKPRARTLSRQVIRAQNALRKLTTRRAWVAYLKVEEAVNEREFARADTIAILALRLATKRAREDVVVQLGRRALENFRRGRRRRE